MKTKLLGLFIIPLTLCSCSSSKNEKAIKNIMSFENKRIELTVDELISFIDLGIDFPLLMYTEYCSLCDKAIENINNYIKDSHQQFYSIVMNQSIKDTLYQKYPTYFNINESYPKIAIFNDKEVSYKIDTNDTQNYTALKRLLTSNLIETNLYTLTTKESYKEYKENNKDYMLFSFIDNSNESTNYIYKKIINNDKKALFLPKNSLNHSLIALIDGENNLGIDTFTYLSIYEDGINKKASNYLDLSKEEIDSLFL